MSADELINYRKYLADRKRKARAIARETGLCSICCNTPARPNLLTCEGCSVEGADRRGGARGNEKLLNEKLLTERLLREKLINKKTPEWIDSRIVSLFKRRYHIPTISKNLELKDSEVYRTLFKLNFIQSPVLNLLEQQYTSSEIQRKLRLTYRQVREVIEDLGRKQLI